MKINQSTVDMQSQHASVLQRTQQSSLRAWVGHRRPDFEGQRVQADAGSSTWVSLSAQAQTLASRQAASATSAPQAEDAAVDAVDQANAAVRNDQTNTIEKI